MRTVIGQYNRAIIFNDLVDEGAVEQIQELCDQPFSKGSRVRVMPDVHAGAGCTIGTTMTITDKVVPNMVGVDIGCGMEVVQLRDTRIDFARLDVLIRSRIPSGHDVRKSPHPFNDEINLDKLRCGAAVNLPRAIHSIGTLGGVIILSKSIRARTGRCSSWSTPEVARWVCRLPPTTRRKAGKTCPVRRKRQFPKRWLMSKVNSC